MNYKDRYTEWRDGHGAGKAGKDCYTQLAKYEDLEKSPEEMQELIKNAGRVYDVEYAAFVWNTRNESYEQIGRPVGTEMICRNRLQERISNGWLNNDYDTSKTEIKRRTITMFASEWEALG